MKIHKSLIREHPIKSTSGWNRLFLRTILPVFLTINLFTVATFFLFVPTVKDTLISSQQEKVKELTTTVWSLLVSYHNKVETGELTMEQAKERALSHVRNLHFGKNSKDYFWINDMEHRMILHPYRKDLEGKNLYELQDEKGFYLFREFVTTVKRSGQGYVEYHWQWQDNPNLILPKNSFVKGFKPWNWIVGTGFYPELVDQKIDQIVFKLKVGLSAIFLVMLLMSLYILRQNRKSERDRELSQKLWRHSEARYQKLIESMKEGLVIQDERDIMIYVNESFSRILGYPRETLEGRSIFDFLDSENQKLLISETRQRLKAQHSSTYELSWKGNNKTVYTLISGHPFQDQIQKISGTFALIVDITEQKKGNLAIKESEKKFRAAFETNPNLVIIFRISDGCYVDVNPGFSNLTGYSREEFIGKRIGNALIWKDETQKIRIADKILQSKTLDNEEVRVTHKNGQTLTLLLSTKPITINKEPHIVCFGRDITEKIEVEEKYYSILNTMKDGYCEFDLHGQHLYSNQAFKKIVNLTTEEVQFRKYSEFITLSNKERIYLTFNKIFETGESIEAIETEINRTDGTSAFLEFSAALIRGNEGEAIGFSCIFRDISQRKKVEKEMEQMRLTLKSSIDLMPSALIIMDSRAIVTQWNIEAEKITGIPFYEAVGKDIDQALPGFPRQSQNISQVINTRIPYKAEKLSISTGSNTRYFDIDIYPIHSSRIEGAVLRVDDVTKRVRMEEIMIQSEKMMSVGELAAGTAHEINNPLGGVIQSTQNVLRRISPDQERNHKIAEESGVELEAIIQYLEKQKITYYLEGIRESGLRAADIVSRMLQFSRKSESQKTPARIDEIVEQAINLVKNDFDLKKRYDFKAVTIKREYEEDLPPVECVAMEIEQVVLNILKNAAQAMGENSDQNHPEITLKLNRYQNSAQISISDNGPGMPDAVRKRIFEPFYTTKPVGQGTGLGLSVSYMIITNNHRGTIEVFSTPEKGTSFVIRIPFTSPSTGLSN